MTEISGINKITGKRTAFLNLGCKVNAYETEAMQQLFEEAGAMIVDFSECADIYVINTCTVTNIADRKSRQMLHRAKHKNEAAIVVAAGCYVQAAKEELKQDISIDILVGNNMKKEIIAIVNEYLHAINSFETDTALQKNNLQRSESHIIDISKQTEYETLELETVVDKTRAYIKIQDGCNQFCSYCIIPYARGRIRSRKAESIITEVKLLAAKGYQEIVLTGIHLSSYGFEDKTAAEQASLQSDEEAALLSLIRELNSIDGIKRIRLGSLEPRIMTEDFVKTLSGFSGVCPHFHLSLQSGCDETLKRMNRKYKTADYAKSCRVLRKYFDDPAITTDVIVGFPGETKEEFIKTKEFLEEIKFAGMHIFSYSKRKGTVAEKLKNQVPDVEKNSRSDILLRVELNMRRIYKEGHYGRVDSVLFEESLVINGENYMTGYTSRYEKVVLKTEESLSNQLILVIITGHIEKDLLLVKKLD